MDIKKITKHLVNVRKTSNGIEWRMKTPVSPSLVQELATFLHKELGHEVVISAKEDCTVTLSPKGNPPGGLMTFRQHVKELFPDPWAKSGELVEYLDELPLE